MLPTVNLDIEQAGFLQDPQMLGDVVVGGVETTRDFADTERRPKQQTNDAYSSVFAERSKRAHAVQSLEKQQIASVQAGNFRSARHGGDFSTRMSPPRCLAHVTVFWSYRVYVLVYLCALELLFASVFDERLA
jgi:hypothetical protein